jgi:putative ABC transport system permease protein
VTFVLRMAWREIRASWTRLTFFFLCVAVGVAAIVAVRSVIQTVRDVLTREARALVGADLVVQSGRPWQDDVSGRLTDILTRPGVTGRAEVIETATMASTDVGVRLVELRAVEAGFPYYGTLELGSGRAFSHDLLRDGGLLVQPELLVQLGVAVGESVTIAGRSFEVRDTVVSDRVQGRGGFAMGPRVYLDVADLRETTILQFGSRARYAWYVQVVPDVLRGISRDLRREFRRDQLSIRTWETTEDRLGRNLTLAENYLSLVGFAMVVMGGIGVWSVTRVFILQKIKSVAVLKCVGATSGRILATYLLQIVVLAVAGGLCGVAIAAVAIAAIPASVLELVGVQAIRVTMSAAVQGLTVGALVSLLFAVVPLLEIREVKPLLLLRADTTTSARKRGWQSVTAAAVIGAALTAVAVWQADALDAGLYVSTGLAVVALALASAGGALVRLVRPLAASRSFALRHAVISLGRPGNQTRVILTAVGLGCFFILGVRSIQSNLITEFSLDVGAGAPDLVLIDIQRDQLDGVRAVIQPYLRAEPTLLPLLRGRVVGVDGRAVQLESAEEVRRQGELGREYGLTFRNALADNEELLDGEFWDGPATDPDAPLEVSIEARIRDEHRIGLADRIRFDIAGRTIDAVVTSVRKVAWDDTQNGGFIFVFRPGPVIERAPYTLVGFLNVQENVGARGGVQRALVDAYPNVTAIDVSVVLATVRDVVANATMAISIVGGVTVVGGLLILVGAVSMTKFQRVYDAAIYRTLGASTRRLAAMVTIEYGMLGTLAGLLGAVGALGLSWAVATQLFGIDWRPDWLALGLGVVLAGVVVSFIGLVSSADVIVRKPLGTLRGG